MSNDNIEKQLEMLCVDLLKQLEKLKEKNLISQKDYIKHTKLKREFLDRINRG